METKNKTFESVESWVEAHNLYTIYTQCFGAFATGERSVAKPGIAEEGYDPLTGLGILRDKDICGIDSTRMIWIAEEFRKHLKLYNDYRQRLLAACCKLPDQLTLMIDTKMFYLKLENRAGGYRLTVQDARPKVLSVPYKKLGYFAEANANRSFIRSELQEAGCPTCVIELFLGHAERGEEGYSPSSAMHPEDYRRDISNAMSRLLDRIGFKAMPAPDIGNLMPDIAKVSLQSTQEKPLPWPPTNPPGDLWQEIRKKNVPDKPRKKVFTKIQQKLLLDVQKKLPDLYLTPAVLTASQEDIDGYYYKLDRFGAKNCYKMQMFLHKLLAKGQKTHHWPIHLPNKPQLVKREKNLLTDLKEDTLFKARLLEQAFLADIKKPIPGEASLRVGQILLSCALYGGLLDVIWMEAAAKALFNGLYQQETCLWLDLWRKERPSDNYERFRAQLQPDTYRRWEADPTTQYLIYRWLRLPLEDRNLESISALPIIKSYLKFLGHPLEDEQELPALLRQCQALALTWLPPFLLAYANGRNSSASLPDERWFRARFGITIPAPTSNSRLQTLSPPVIFCTHYLRSRQQTLYKKLIKEISKSTDPKKAQDNIQQFIEKHQDVLSPVAYLLCLWAKYLFSDKPPQPHGYHDAPLALSTVEGYLSTLWDPLIDTFENKNPLDLDEDDFSEVYHEIADKFLQKATTENQAQKLNILRHFHSFLDLEYDATPYPPELEPNMRSARVSANVLTETDYGRLLNALNWQQPQASRLERITACVLILGFRAGARRTEILGLRLKDIDEGEWLEVLLRPFKGRSLKSGSARRVLPLDRKTTPEELDFLIKWIHNRREEPGVKGRDFLFTYSALDRQMITDREIMVPLRTAIKTTTSDPYAVFHHTRHSYYTNMVVQMLLREDIDSGPLPYFLEKVRPLSPELKNDIDGNITTGQGRLLSLAILMGHADATTGLHSYFHMSEWLVSYFSRHSIILPKFSAKTITEQLKLKPHKTNYIKRSKLNLLLHGVEKMAGGFSKKLKHPLLANAIEEPPALPQVFPTRTLPSFEKNVAEAMATLNRSDRPKDRYELEFVRSAVERVSRLHPRKRQRVIANTKKLAKNMRHNTLILSSFGETRDALEFLSITGFPLEEMSYGLRRKAEEKTESYDSVLARWNRKFEGLNIEPLSPNRHGRRLEIRHETPDNKPLHLRLFPLITKLIDLLGKQASEIDT